MPQTNNTDVNEKEKKTNKKSSSGKPGHFSPHDYDVVVTYEKTVIKTCDTASAVNQQRSVARGKI